MAEMRLTKKYRAMRCKYDAFTWASTAYERILVPDSITTNATEDSAHLSEGIGPVDGPIEVEYTFVLPISFDDAVIDGDVFVNTRIYLTGPASGFSQFTSLYVTVKKIDSAGSSTNLSASEVQIYSDTLQESSGTSYYQVFGWVPVYNQYIESDERLALTLKGRFNDTLGSVTGGFYYGVDSDYTYIIVPFV